MLSWKQEEAEPILRVSSLPHGIGRVVGESAFCRLGEGDILSPVCIVRG